MATCALCKSDKLLKESHIIPQFVFDRIKNNSPTGFLRGGVSDVNLRRQGGDKPKMLCGDCEQRFSKAEKKFAEKVFEPYHESGTTSFTYGPWLSYFISSVNWRTLHLDNIGFHFEKKLADDALSVLDDAETMLADFLLGKRADIGDMKNHILPMFEVTDANSSLREPNFYIRISALDYTFVDPANNGFYVFANLAGVMIFTVIRKGRKDVWENTLVQPDGGSIKQPPVRVSSPLMFDMVQRLVECSEATVSQAQRNKIIESLKANSQAAQAKAVQIREFDKKLPNKEEKHTKTAIIAFVPALIVTGLIVTPLLLLFDHLELTGQLKLPHWLVWPAIFGILALFRLIWIILGGIIEKYLFKKGA